MTKPQIVVRISPYLLEKLNNYAQQTGISKTESKTEVEVGALACYLGWIENLPLNQRVTELEVRTTVLEALVKAS